ncbi:putative Histone-lysine N-methyltransferase, H3 lysine-9 specific dim-5 [Seiridium unicorne]|uniref:Histone-lysine N-methyltransferase, H3 lysine-9 specific dim-5 n=1 Tax=Seiridium unicorne TaxID=138068 RepID=A0ABR2UDP7_9PEZI
MLGHTLVAEVRRSIGGTSQAKSPGFRQLLGAHHSITIQSLRPYNNSNDAYVLSKKSYQELVEYAKFTLPIVHVHQAAVLSTDRSTSGSRYHVGLNGEATATRYETRSSRSNVQIGATIMTRGTAQVPPGSNGGRRSANNRRPRRVDYLDDFFRDHTVPIQVGNARFPGAHAGPSQTWSGRYGTIPTSSRSVWRSEPPRNPFWEIMRIVLWLSAAILVGYGIYRGGLWTVWAIQVSVEWVEHTFVAVTSATKDGCHALVTSVKHEVDFAIEGLKNHTLNAPDASHIVSIAIPAQGIFDGNRKEALNGFYNGLEIPKYFSISLRRAQDPRTSSSSLKWRNGANGTSFIMARRSHPDFPVTIINRTDDAVPSPDFHFTDHSVFGPGVEPARDEFRSGCDCEDGEECQYNTCHCLQEMEDSEDESELEDETYGDALRRKTFAYHTHGIKKGHLRSKVLESREPIYECHDGCACGPDCPNRVVERGRKIPLQIFRTPNRGWGVRSMVDIKRGQFIDKYMGEIITPAEADRRRAHSDIAQRKDVYLFALDKFSDPESPDERLRGPSLEVDGEFMSGPTRFINHSCDPNLRIFARVGDHADKHIHDLAFFAIQDIPRGDELTFDYVDGVDDSANDALDPAKKKDMAVCLCGSPKCRGFLW